MSVGSKAAYAYEPETGSELWRVENRESHSGSATPVIGEDLIYFCRSFVALSNTELIYRYPELVMVEVGPNDSGEDRISKIIAVYRKFAKEVLAMVNNREAAPTSLISLPTNLTALHQSQL